MALSKEQAETLADQIMKKAEQESITVRNASAARFRVPIMCRTQTLMRLEPYQRVQILLKAKERSFEHPLYRKALYVYIIFGLLFLRHVLKTSQNTSVFDTYAIMVLLFTLVGFELYRAYLVRFYMKKVLEEC